MQQTLNRYRMKYLALLPLLILIPLSFSACISQMKNTIRAGKQQVIPAPAPAADRQKPAGSPATKGSNQSVSATCPPEPTLKLTITDAVLLGLGNNEEFKVERLNPPITQTAEREERAKFDNVVNAKSTLSRNRSDRQTVTRHFDAAATISRFFPIGATMDVEGGSEWNKDMPSSNDPESDWRSYINLRVTQPLLQGGGTQVNLATLRQARLDTLMSRFELQGKAESLTADIETTYWDYFLGLGQVDIYTQSLGLARRLVRETQERIRIGDKAQTEIYFAQAEAASRQQNLIDAKSFLEETRLRLLRLVNPPSRDLWNRQLDLRTLPMVFDAHLDKLGVHIQQATMLRPDLNQARLAYQRGDLEIIKTRNGLLPKLGVFLTLGRAGYSKHFAGSLHDITAGEGGLDFLAGGEFEFPPSNQAAKAKYDRSALRQSQQKQALDNLSQLVQKEILSAYVEIRRAREQITASEATVKYQQEKRDAELERYRLGRGSMFRISQAERDFVLSRISYVQSRIDYLKGLTLFYFAEGTLLARRGIGLPAGHP